MSTSCAMRATTCREGPMTTASRNFAGSTIGAISLKARRDLLAWLGKWQGRYPRLCDWVESGIEETFSFYRLPRQHYKHLKSTNMLERLNEEIKRRTHVVRIFPNRASCLRLVRALAVEQHENWIEASRYLNMAFLKEQRRELELIVTA